MSNNDFTIPAFLRAIGKGPDEKPEWWEWANNEWQYRKEYERQISKPDPLWNCTAPFADILTAWTSEKDALLLGVGLEWWRANESDEIEVAVYKIGFQSNMFWESELMRDPKPGERLARAIWAVLKGDGK